MINRKTQLAAAFALERREAVVHQDAGAQVDVEVQLEAHGQQDAFGVLVAGHPRVADRAEIDGGEVAPQGVHESRREDGAVLQVSLGAEVEPLELQREAQALEQADSLAGDLGADSVAGDDCDAVGHGARSLAPWKK